ncbi:MAG: hypothetical protein WCA28_26480 [Bradyrhizobium sp.]
MGNGLRDEHGRLIDGLVVEEYGQGIDDYNTGATPPEISSASYDLGRQRAAEQEAKKRAFFKRQADEHRRRMLAMQELLPPDLFEQYARAIQTIELAPPSRRTPNRRTRTVRNS